jgi:hypothetical protein
MPMLAADIDLATFDDAITHADRVAILKAAGLPESGLLAYASKVRLTGYSTGESPERTLDDIRWMIVHTRNFDGYGSVLRMSLASLIGFALLQPSDLPPLETLAARGLAWGYRPEGFLAAAAGYTPSEYETLIPTPDVDALVTLAVLRHGPVFADLAEELR